MKILSIGNSFSQDAHKWLMQVAESCNDKIEAVNLYIGGCSLETHWNKYTTNESAYDLEINGQFIRKSSIAEALKLMDWDAITFQQASVLSGDYSTYQPYLINLYSEVKKVCSNAKFYIHETWSYETDTSGSAFARYNNSQKEMYRALKVAYKKAANAINAPIIPVGEMIQYLRESIPEFDYKNGGLSLNRDGCHLSFSYGRYVAALVWYGVLCRKDIRGVRFIPPEADESLINILKNAVFKELQRYNEE